MSASNSKAAHARTYTRNHCQANMEGDLDKGTGAECHYYVNICTTKRAITPRRASHVFEDGAEKKQVILFMSGCFRFLIFCLSVFNTLTGCCLSACCVLRASRRSASCIVGLLSVSCLVPDDLGLQLGALQISHLMTTGYCRFLFACILINQAVTGIDVKAGRSFPGICKSGACPASLSRPFKCQISWV